MTQVFCPEKRPGRQALTEEGKHFDSGVERRIDSELEVRRDHNTSLL